MSDIKKKLDALKKSHNLLSGGELLRAPKPAPAEESGEGGTMRDRLRRLGVAREDGAAVSPAAPASTPAPSRRTESAYDVHNVFLGEEVGGDSPCFRVRTEYPLEHRQGHIELGDILGISANHIAFSSADAALAAFEPRTAVFMDTETTGLMGGAGTVPFLVGMGYFTEDCFCLDQYFLRDFHEEEAMLRDAAARLDGMRTLVSYNGKSFDLPLLRTRFIQHRIPFRAEAAAHLDLVHASRRFWKRRLSDCSLGNIEREILGIHRDGDVPGYMIPPLWFDYLRNRDARPLEGVFYHHRMDILSLVTLTAWLAQCLEAPEGHGFEHAEDRLSVIRLHFRQRNYDEVLRLGAPFEREEPNPMLRRECLEMLAMACKRRGLWEEMEEAWEKLLEAHPGDLLASLELAKHHEHRTRDLERAAALCAAVLERVDTQLALGRPVSITATELNTFRTRLERIQKKLAKGRNNETGGLDFA